MKYFGTSYFILTFFTLYFVIHAYLYLRTRKPLTHLKIIKGLWFVLFLSLPIGRLLDIQAKGLISEVVITIGGFYFPFMLYSFILLLFIDLVRLVNKLFPFLPKILYRNVEKTRKKMTFIVASIVFLVVFLGHINAITLQLEVLELSISKNAGQLKDLNIVFFSDIHYGNYYSYARTLKTVNKVNQLNPDIILLGGDITDRKITEKDSMNMIRLLKGLKAKYGVYAVLGNHDYIDKYQKAIEYLNRAGIKVLMDETLPIDNAFNLVGRKDKSVFRLNETRKTLNELLMDVDKKLPIIVLEHQPDLKNEVEMSKADLRIAGHSHSGQLFPFNLIVKSVYAVSYGYVKQENTHVYVSSGMGYAGTPVRILSHPEIVQIKLHFKE